VHERLWKQIASEAEIAYFRAGDELLRAALLFSAKETFYKAQFCVSESWVGFHDAHVALDERGAFELELLVDVGAFFRKGARFAGMYCVLEGHVVTGMVI
jgi:4'-phosphopantetheinyl transferase EntD